MPHQTVAQEPQVFRHKAAIRRHDLSLPVKCLLRDEFLAPGRTFLDYGCGRGEDVQHLLDLGFEADGWDPAFRPNGPRHAADIVNLGYVLNVIEDTRERADTLRNTWSLSRKLLCVAARIVVGSSSTIAVEYNDGILTRIGTFQKHFTQAELCNYIEMELQAEALPAAPGVFYVFKDEELRQHFLSNRYSRKRATPRKRATELRFEQNREVLQPLMDWFTAHGRLPQLDELSDAPTITAEFGSLKRAFALIRRVTGPNDWESIRKERTSDLLVYLALANFRRRPRLSKLPVELQHDIRAFFGTYKSACSQADDLLFQAGKPEAIDETCKRSPVGKLLPNALYIHRSALESLEPILRIYEGCARSYLGEIDGANIIKLHRFSGKVSYLIYPDFETDPHPALLRCVKLCMRSQSLDCYNYSDRDNPPVLHRKESFLLPDHPLLAKFERLTKQEERYSLLDNPSSIGTRQGWEARLFASGLRLRGHRLVRASKHP